MYPSCDWLLPMTKMPDPVNTWSLIGWHVPRDHSFTVSKDGIGSDPVITESQDNVNET